jgi:hypothetical protein
MFSRSILFRDEVNDRLVVEAEERKVSVTWLVNQLCQEGLDRLAPEIKVTT